ncbi:MAG: GGDEF domain-containing protein [Thermodesulfobacteriota bacterium]|nr:GGDEF domain-containing protein [Thermodesulfobacteriota bacterium]
MSAQQDDRLIRDFTSLAVDGLKRLSEKGEKLTSESLYEVLSRMPEAQRLMAVDGDEADPSIHDRLQQDIERLSRQKDSLMSELSAVEEKAVANEAAFRRIVLFFAEFIAKTEEEAVYRQSRKLAGVVRDNASTEVIEAVFSELKTMADKTAVATAGGSTRPKKTFLRNLLKVPGTDAEDVEKRYIDQFRKTYQDIIDTLGSELGEMFLSRLASIGGHIKAAGTINDFLTLRMEILSLVKDYMDWVASERETVTDFVKELGTKLISFEKILNSAFENTTEIYSSNDAFAEVIEEKLDGMTDFLRSSRTLEELKTAVTARLDSMRQAITAQREREAAIRRKMDRDIALMKNDFKRMKTEALEAKVKAEQLEKESLTDPLTGACNRRAFDRRITEEISRLIRYKRHFSMLIFDVDYFKSVNDTYGHAAGDQCLRAIVAKVHPLLRETDMLARYGGEEFAVILPETKGTGAAQVAEKLRAAVAAIEIPHGETTIGFTISIGASMSRHTDKTPGDLFGRVDMALYSAKEGGRNRVVVK